MMHLTRVLLPAPFSPSRARNVPGVSVNDTLDSAWSDPKRLDRLVASRRGGSVLVVVPLADEGRTVAEVIATWSDNWVMPEPPAGPWKGQSRRRRHPAW